MVFPLPFLVLEISFHKKGLTTINWFSIFGLSHTVCSFALWLVYRLVQSLYFRLFGYT